MRNRAMISTEPTAVLYACRFGVTSNPRYLQCHNCPNFDFCEVRQERELMSELKKRNDALKRAENPNYDIEEGMKILKQREYENSFPAFVEKLKNFFVKILIVFVIFVILFLLS